MSPDTEKDGVGLISVRLGSEGQPVDLALVEELSEQLRSALNELVREQGSDSKVKLLVQDVQKGSIVLQVEPVLPGEQPSLARQVSASLIRDLNLIERSQPRSQMSANLFGLYGDLVRTAEKAGKLELSFDGASCSIGPANAGSFLAAMRDQPEAGVEIVGVIETINIHRRPWTFGLYTKLDRQRVACQFPDPMLDQILGLLNSRSLVLVTGEGRFAPVGVTPRSIELTEPPTPLVFQPDVLRSFRRSADILREGEAASTGVSRIREERAPYG